MVSRSTEGNFCTRARLFCFCCTIICYFTRAFLWKRLATGSSLNPRYLLLCMTTNKSEHEMLIHGTLCPLSRGKNVNWTTILQAVSSVNVTPLFLDEPTCIVVGYESPMQRTSSALKLWNMCTVSVELSRGTVDLCDVSLPPKKQTTSSKNQQTKLNILFNLSPMQKVRGSQPFGQRRPEKSRHNRNIILGENKLLKGCIPSLLHPLFLSNSVLTCIYMLRDKNCN